MLFHLSIVFIYMFGTRGWRPRREATLRNALALTDDAPSSVVCVPPPAARGTPGVFAGAARPCLSSDELPGADREPHRVGRGLSPAPRTAPNSRARGANPAFWRCRATLYRISRVRLVDSDRI
ncbi:hypothetical protein caldi_04080 [Caldinitratiruptor microaerophilus]|uniref:Uncharacterized protein n=1 Tax=Caldinitratiruptor microaerophilus TaxID=671077 RepID=A0AA35CJ55_9FIRM|nr:hypothetical protein caldi_04080 [Caldinitratiruptor microaerophilus]